MKTKRRVTIAVACVAVAALMLVGMTLAYLTDSRTVNNILGIGTGEGGQQAVQLSLEEPSFAAHADETEYMFSNPDSELLTAETYGLLPGDKIYKDPIITNSGTDSVYLRARVDVSAEMLVSIAELGLAINPAFVNGQDGYWYYADAQGAKEFTSGASVNFFVTVADATDPLNTQGLANYSMTIPNTWTNMDVMSFLNEYRAYEGNADAKYINIPVVAEAVQFENLTVSVPWDMDDEIGHNIYAISSEERSR